MTSAYIFLLFISNFERVIVCVNCSAFYNYMRWEQAWLIFFFTHRCREQFNCIPFSVSPSHFGGSPEACLIGGSQVFSLCFGRFSQHTSLLVMLIWGGFSFNSIMIRFSSALLLFSMVVGFVMSADIIFLWHTYHLHAHKALKVIIIFS